MSLEEQTSTSFESKLMSLPEIKKILDTIKALKDSYSENWNTNWEKVFQEIPSSTKSMLDKKYWVYSHFLLKDFYENPFNQIEEHEQFKRIESVRNRIQLFIKDSPNFKYNSYENWNTLYDILSKEYKNELRFFKIDGGSTLQSFIFDDSPKIIEELERSLTVLQWLPLEEQKDILIKILKKYNLLGGEKYTWITMSNVYKYLAWIKKNSFDPSRKNMPLEELFLHIHVSKWYFNGDLWQFQYALAPKKQMKESEIQEIVSQYTVNKWYRDIFISSVIFKIEKSDLAKIFLLLAKKGTLWNDFRDHIDQFQDHNLFREMVIAQAPFDDKWFTLINTLWNKIPFEWNFDLLKKYIQANFKIDKSEIVNCIEKSPYSEEQKSELHMVVREREKEREILVSIATERINDAYFPKINEFLNDPSIQGVEKILGIIVWLLWNDSLKFVNSQNLPMLNIIVTRNLYFQNKPITKESVLREIKNIFENYEAYKWLQLFAWRNIVFAAHSESALESAIDKWGDNYRFWRKWALDAIQAQWWKYNLLRPDKTQESLKDRKLKILESIEKTPPPFTFVFDWHGSEDSLYFSDGQIKGVTDNQNSVVEDLKTIKISAQEFLTSYKKRIVNFPSNLDDPKEQKDIFIIVSCNNHTFVRNIYEWLWESKQKPIFVCPTEYWQYSYSNRSIYWDDFFEKVFQFSTPWHVTTLEDMWKGKFEWNIQAPTVYFPDNEGTLRQFSEGERLTNFW